MSNPLLIPIEKDEKTKRNDILTNIVNMLYFRLWISKDKLEKTINNLINNQNDDNIYNIKLDVKLNNVLTYDPYNDKKGEFDDDVVIIKLLPQKITSINKNQSIVDFTTTYKKNHKILVVENISEKTKNQINNYQYLEIFKESFLMQNILENVCSPKYEVLTPDESDKLLEAYNLKKNHLKLMFDSDPVSECLFLKKKQIVRIIRNSEITINSIDYRIVIHKGG